MLVIDQIHLFDPQIKYNFYKNKFIDEKLTNEQNNALQMLDLSLPLTIDKIKKKYKNKLTINK